MVKNLSLPTAVPQDLVSVEGPLQPIPHSLPAIQGRDRVWVPDPQLTEQALHGPYAPYLELTKKGEEFLFKETAKLLIASVENNRMLGQKDKFPISIRLSSELRQET